ncbi:family S53 protease [Marasmius fiardii PR-910]|nr:family S53 protease [Marasmius fiardii PR-910]
MVRTQKLFTALVSFGSTTLAFVTPQRRDSMIAVEARPIPQGFTRVQGSNFAENALTLSVALKPKDRDGLEKSLYAVSTPGSSSYGQHLNYQQVKAYMEPQPEAVVAVTKWLSDNKIANVNPSGVFEDWLTFQVPASKAGSLLNANFETFRHDESGEEIVRTLEYSIPKDLLPHVALVHPTTSFALRPRPEPRLVAPAVNDVNITVRANPAPASCDTNVTPACLQALYGIPATPATQSNNRIGVTGFIGEWAQNADLKAFLTLLRPDMSSDTSFTVQSVDGGENNQDPTQAGIEANLDIQYTVGIATDVPVTFITVGDQNNDDVAGFLDVINVLIAEDNPPPVLSTSYGFDETDLGPELAGRICDTYMALSARGVSNVFSTGDGGVWGSRDLQCVDFVPTFPAGCPYITAVGSTNPGSSPGEEVASDFSSGGFSNFFARPSYQDSAVNAYLQAIGSDNAGKYNASNRGYPDVSARGITVQIVNAGSTILVRGTSCSTPIFASVIALVNDRLIAAGKPVLGFLNPFLYAHPEAFFDTTAGTNDGPNCEFSLFPWDASTGLGTPNFNALLTAAGL